MPSKGLANSNDTSTLGHQTACPEAQSGEIQHQKMIPARTARNARVAPWLLVSSDMVQLQRTIGNRAVGRMLAGTAFQREETPDQEGELQPIRRQLQPHATPETLSASQDDHPIDAIQGEGEISQDPTIIQRKVGFEFETAVPVKTTPGSIKVPYGVQIYEAGDQSWQIKSDNSKVEFVTKEVDDTLAGKDKVGQVMKQVTGWAKGMAALTKTAEPPGTGKLSDVLPNYGQAKQYKAQDVVLNSLPLSPTDVVAAPQATGGVTLDKIPALIDQMIAVKLNHLRYSETFKPQFEPPQAPDYSSMTEENAQLAQIKFEEDEWMYQNTTKSMTGILDKQGHDTQDISYSAGVESLVTIVYLTAAKEAVQKFILNEVETKTEVGEIEQFQDELGMLPSQFRARTLKLQGLLTLVISYLLGGEASDKPVPYTKSIATLMSRTNIFELHKLLTAAEKKLFSPEFVFYLSGLEDGPLFKGGFNSRGMKVAGPKRSEWIESIIKGTKLPLSEDVVGFDRLSQGSQTPEALNSASLGALATPDDNIRTGEKNLAVLEIRNMPKNQTIDDWTQTAFTVFDLFMRLNMTPEERKFFDDYAQLKRHHREVMVGRKEGDKEYRRDHLQKARVLIEELKLLATDSVDEVKMLDLVKIYEVGLLKLQIAWAL